MLKKADLWEVFLDEGILSTLNLWLTPLPDGSLPNLLLRTALFEILDRLPITSDALEDTQLAKTIVRSTPVFYFLRFLSSSSSPFAYVGGCGFVASIPLFD